MSTGYSNKSGLESIPFERLAGGSESLGWFLAFLCNLCRVLWPCWPPHLMRTDSCLLVRQTVNILGNATNRCHASTSEGEEVVEPWRITRTAYVNPTRGVRPASLSPWAPFGIMFIH